MLPPSTRKTILRLVRNGASVSRAAKEAKVSRQTVYRLLQREGVESPAKRRRKVAKKRPARKKSAKVEKPLGEMALSVDWRALYRGEKGRLTGDTADFLRDVLGAEDDDNFLIAATAAGFSLSQIGVPRALLAKYPFEV